MGVGAGIDWPQLEARLDACLVGSGNDDEPFPYEWANLEDPFPLWRRTPPSE